MAKQVQRTITTKPAETRTASGKRVVRETKKKVTWAFPLTRKNFLIMGIGLGLVILGYILMATGITEQPALPDSKWDNTLAVNFGPILLVLGYCVVIPYSIIKFFGNKKEDSEE